MAYTLQYSKVEELAIGPYFFDSSDGTVAPIHFCTDSYESAVIFGSNESYVFDSNTDENCVEIGPSDITSGNFSMEAFLAKNNASVSFSRLLEAELRFNLKTIRFHLYGPLKSPDCYRFNISVRIPSQSYDCWLLLLDNCWWAMLCDFNFCFRFISTTEIMMVKCFCHLKPLLLNCIAVAK